MTVRRKAVSWRSGLEDQTAEDLAARGVPYRYEEVKLEYTQPASNHTYTPDFILPNGIVVETKGLFDVDDRKKHKLIRAQFPHLDIRLVFSRSASPLRKGAKSSYGDWCRKHGILFADAPTAAQRKRGITQIVPQEWIDEPACPVRLQALADAAR